jgi:hypothetical protein
VRALAGPGRLLGIEESGVVDDPVHGVEAVNRDDDHLDDPHDVAPDPGRARRRESAGGLAHVPR